MSVLKYNGITLPYCSTTDFRQEAIGDDMGDTDYCYTKYDITVTSIINIDYLETIFPDFAGRMENPVQIMHHIRTKLLERRKEFSFTFNGYNLVTIKQGSNRGTVDARNGPIPQSCNYTALTNTSFLIVYRIVIHVWENPDDSSLIELQNQRADDVLYNRWIETVSIDNCQYSTKVRQGKYVIRSDNTSGRIADYFRNDLAVLSIPNGFVRERSDYTVSPDGLSLNYTVEDREVYRMPPSPSLEASGEYTESAGNAGLPRRFGRVKVNLKGHKLVQQSRLIETAVSLGVSVLMNRAVEIRTGSRGLPTAVGGVVGGGAFQGLVTALSSILFLEASVTRALFSNEVSFHAQCMYPLTNRRFSRIAGLAGMDDGTPFTNGFSPNPEYRDRGTANLLLRAAAYYDPNALNHNLGPADLTHLTNPVEIGNTKIQTMGRPDIGTLGP